MYEQSATEERLVPESREDPFKVIEEVVLEGCGSAVRTCSTTRMKYPIVTHLPPNARLAVELPDENQH